MNIKSILARLDRLEETVKGPEKWHFVRYYAPMDIPEEERAAKETAARAEYEAENGPINEHDSICWIIRIVNAPREQTNPQPESIAGPPQDAPEAQTAPEAMQSTAKGHSI